MPIYVYVCSQGHVFEQLRPTTESGEGALCPSCGMAGSRKPAPPSVKVLGGTPTFYPGREHK